MTELMHVAVEEPGDEDLPPPQLERTVIGQERDPTPPRPHKQEPEDILDLDVDIYSSTERRKSCKQTHFYTIR